MIHNSRKILATTTALAIILPLNSGFAADEAEDKFAIEEIIVMSRRRAESVQDVPAAITVFSAATIESARIEQVGDFIALTAGLTLREQFSPSFVNLTVRGIMTQQNGELPIALAVDGVTVPFSSFLNQDLLDVVQVEVLKGPQGGLYGRNAIAGAININTRRPGNEMNGKIRVTYGNGDFKQFRGVFSGPIVEDSLFAKIGFSYKDSDGLIKSSLTGEGVDAVEETTVFGRVIYDASEGLSIDLRAKYTSSDTGSAYFSVVPVEDIDIFNRSNDSPVSTLAINDRELYEFSAKIDYESEFGNFTSITSYFDVKDFLFGEADWEIFAPPQTIQDFRTTVDGWSQEFRFTSPDDQVFRWIVGAFYQDRDNTTFVDLLEDLAGDLTAPFFLIEDSASTSESWAVFGQAAYDITDKLEISFAMRYDEDKRSSTDLTAVNDTLEKTFSNFQPKITISYDLDEDFLLYATWGEGFRSGGFNGSFLPAESRTFAAEDSTTYELGFKAILLDGRVQANAAVYHIDYTGQQFFAFIDPVTSVIVNADETDIDGAELEVTMHVSEYLDMIANFGFTDGEITENRPDAFGETFVGNTSPGTNRYTFNLAATYTRPLGNSGLDWTIRADYERRGSIVYEFNNFHRTGAKDLINIRSAIQNDVWSLSAFVRNLTDERYPLTAESFLGPDVVFRLPNRPRTYGVDLSYSF